MATEYPTLCFAKERRPGWITQRPNSFRLRSIRKVRQGGSIKALPILDAFTRVAQRASDYAGPANEQTRLGYNDNESITSKKGDRRCRFKSSKSSWIARVSSTWLSLTRWHIPPLKSRRWRTSPGRNWPKQSL